MRAEGAWRTATIKARAAAPRRGFAWSTVFCFLSVIAAFALSPLMLEMIGIHYDTAGGTPLDKNSPATYLAILALLALSWERGPENLLSDIVRQHKLTLLFALTWLLQLAYIIMRGGVITSTIDTYVFPMVLLFIVTRQDARALHWLALLIHAFMAANAALALVEFVTQWRLTPMVAMGVELIDWRSSALLGHPLSNASATGCYALILMLGGSRDLPRWSLPPLLGLQLVAMVAFGGRAATGTLVAATVIIGLIALVRLLSGQRFSLTAGAVAALGIPLVVLGIAVMVDAGALDKFIDRFTDDGNSAGSRVLAFDVFNSFRFDELLVGPDPATLAQRQRSFGIEFGVENFVLAMILYYGLLTCIPFFIGLLAFMTDVRRASRFQAWFAIAYFLFVCSTSLSIAGKTTLVGLLVVMIVALLRPPETMHAPAAKRARGKQKPPRMADWRPRKAKWAWPVPGAFSKRPQST